MLLHFRQFTGIKTALKKVVMKLTFKKNAFLR